MPKKGKVEDDPAPSKRIQREFTELLEAQSLPGVFNLRADDVKLLIWRALILPEKEPYNTGAWDIEINFPENYPFRPPKITFHTKIYHPNIDEKGQVCLAIIGPENWKPTARMELVLNALVALISDPDIDNPLRPDVAEEFIKDRKKFMRVAEDFTRKHSERRPDEDEIREFVKKLLKQIQMEKKK